MQRRSWRRAIADEDTITREARELSRARNAA